MRRYLVLEDETTDHLKGGKLRAIKRDSRSIAITSRLSSYVPRTKASRKNLGTWAIQGKRLPRENLKKGGRKLKKMMPHQKVNQETKTCSL